jgi:hypothetical protein
MVRLLLLYRTVDQRWTDETQLKTEIMVLMLNERINYLCVGRQQKKSQRWHIPPML